MSDTVFCGSCGEPTAGDAKFCEQCGVELEQRPKAVLPGVERAAPALARVQAAAPGTSELASQLATQLRTPAVATASIGGALAALGTFGVGLILGLVLSDQSELGLVDIGKGVVGSAFAQMLNFIQVGYGDGVGKLGPALFVVFPIGACALAAAAQARRTLGLTPLARLASGACVGLVFGLLMLVPALSVGGLGGGSSTVDPDALGAVLLGALWGALGGLLGTYYVVRTALKPGFLASLVPASLHEPARTVYVVLRPLALLLALMTFAGTVTWTAETLLKSNLREGNSTPVATIDHLAYAVEHGVHWTELAGLAQFQFVDDGLIGTKAPVPIGDATKIKTDSAGKYRVFGLSRAMPAYTFVPLLIFLLGAALLCALSGGFAIAERRLPGTPLAAAAWGLLVGPIWALAIVLVNALVAEDFFGRAVGGSVFGTFLLGGAIVGSVGGLVGLQAQRVRATGGAGDRSTSGEVGDRSANDAAGAQTR